MATPLPPPRALVNPLRRAPVDVAEAAPAGVRAHHAGLPGYAPTALRPFPALARELSVADVRVKDETSRLGLPAFKVLGASWAVERLLEGRAAEATVLCAATDGNHGRAVARVARWRGLSARIFVPATMDAARRGAIAGEGASVEVVDGSYDDAVRTAEGAAAAPGHLLVADHAFDDSDPVPGWVAEGYATLFAEAEEQAPAPFDVIVVPVGVGALASAALRFAAGRARAVVGVEPQAAPSTSASLAAGRPVTVPTPGTVMAGLDCGTPSAVAWPAVAAGLAGVVTVADDEATAAVDELAAAGVRASAGGAAAFAGLRALALDPASAELRGAIGLDASSSVLVLVSGGPPDLPGAAL